MRRNRRKSAGAAAVLTVCAVLCACSQQPQAGTADSGNAENVAAQRTVTIQASETVKTVPDMAQLVYAVSTENKDAAACQEENAGRVSQVVEYLKGEGIAETSIATSEFSLDPRYDWSGSRQELIGYQMRTQITVTDVPLDQVGTLLSQGVNSGANEIQSVSYLSSRYDEAYEEALAQAVTQAKAKAEAMAHAENCQVLDVISMEEYSDSQQGRYIDSGISNRMAVQESGASAADMAVLAGELPVTARVQVVYELADQ